MLTAEVVAKRLEPYLVSSSDNGQPEPRVFAAIRQLPKELRAIGFGFFDRNADGTSFLTTDWQVNQKRSLQTLKLLDELTQARFRKLLTALLGPLADIAEETWELLKRSPYQEGYQRRAFRAPNQTSSTFEVRKNWLQSFSNSVCRIRPDVLTPQWLAIWGSYLEDHFSHRYLAQFLAAAINRGDAQGNEVFEILCQSARNEHEIAGMSRMAARALLMSDRADGWDLMQRMLLAAQRQEGLRQVILETVDEAHPQAFRRMLQTIHDEKLARFSAVARAVDVWCGLNYESDQLKTINTAIHRVIEFMDQPTARSKALKSDDAEEVYFALWTVAYEDAHAAISAAERIRSHKSSTVRFVAAQLLFQLALPEVASVLRPMLADDDLQVSLVALDGCQYVQADDATVELEAHASRRFELIEQLFHRMPEKPVMLPPIVWPWTGRAATREHVAGVLVRLLGTLPPTRLLPYLSAVHRYHRVAVVRMLAEQKKWDKLTRETLLELTGNASPDVREAAIDALNRAELTEPEILRIEGLLSRKASDLRIGALKLLLNQSDEAVLATAGRLLESKDALTRLGGLELIRLMLDANRERQACLKCAEAYASWNSKKTKEEQSQLDAILTTPAERLTLDDAFGLMNPKELSPVPRPSVRPVQFFTDATLEILKSLDQLVHAHRETPIRYKRWDRVEAEEVLGATYGLPQPNLSEPIDTQREALPLVEVWETWYRDRPSSMKDQDGLELLRAIRFVDSIGGYWWDDVVKWAAKQPDRREWIKNISSGKSPVRLKYDGIVQSVLGWLYYLHRPEGVEEYLLDSAETYLALVPQSCHDDLVILAEAGESPSPYERDRVRIDWRDQYGTEEWYSALSNRLLYVRETPAQFQRRWNLACFYSQPIPGAEKQRPGLEMSIHAYAAGLATLTDLTDLLLGPRISSGQAIHFGELAEITSRQQRRELRELLAAHPEIQALADRCRERVLQIELARGETPTPATSAALSMSYFGVETLGRILQLIGTNGFKVTNRYSADARLARLPALTEMVRSTYPLERDTQGDFNRVIADCLKAGLREQTILELMFLAPQWTKFVEGYFQWSGLSEGLYWFLAHMKYINADAESAATASGYEAEQAQEGQDDRQTRSAWQRLIAERTPLSDEERANGAIDVDWFHRVYVKLTPKRWDLLALAARFAANPAQAKRASYLGEVLLGKANRKELFAQVTQKKLKESVRLIGLYPLATGAKQAADLTQRYKMLVEYRRYAKGLSSLTKPAAMQALEIGFRNLASTAGFVDPLRLEWAMEADAVKDLARGPVSVSKEGVTVTLALDEFARPVVTTVKNEKPLKAIPPAIKKEKRIVELLERVTDLRRQASRMKESLEAAMCRGDEFEPEELVQLCDHALLKVLLSRLILVAGVQAGYPDKSGNALRDFAGKSSAIKKRSKLRIAHPHDLLERGDWSKWQHDCFQSARVQPFKQVFRELYVVTKQERKDGTRSFRYAEQQVNPQQANALWNARNWHTQDDVFKAFPAEGITTSVAFRYGAGTPLDVEGLTLDFISFYRRDDVKPLKLADVPPRLFSEVMRDLDLVVSVAHRGGVDPEATASTVEMREALVQETCLLLGLKNVKIKQPRVLIKGQLAEYAVHLGSGNVHRMPGGSLCLIPVQAQHRGRLFLPFADDDPRTAEIVSKVLLLAKDQEIQDPSILEQLRR
ncbi:DUF5724 domain-containing protein [Schlesneria paludicola]|uniref:DUF5724 domain-containing protein n=1 Tax=Schlesneria paludicola TaxID=360056 RepID=UPI00029AC127|nr:DUF5724 domain-containing protein [Schlesneria paludicola]